MVMLLLGFPEPGSKLMLMPMLMLMLGFRFWGNPGAHCRNIADAGLPKTCSGNPGPRFWETSGARFWENPGAHHRGIGDAGVPGNGAHYRGITILCKNHHK